MLARLVLLVVFVFLESWRATLIPMLAVPVSLIGTFSAFVALGFSLNTLTLFALVLAIVLAAVFAPWVAPFPAHAGPGVDFAHASQPPGPRYWFGTDLSGRDELSRIIFGYRVSLAVGVIVLSIAERLTGVSCPIMIVL